MSHVAASAVKEMQMDSFMLAEASVEILAESLHGNMLEAIKQRSSRKSAYLQMTIKAPFTYSKH